MGNSGVNKKSGIVFLMGCLWRCGVTVVVQTKGLRGLCWAVKEMRLWYKAVLGSPGPANPKVTKPGCLEEPCAPRAGISPETNSHCGTHVCPSTLLVAGSGN